MICNQNERYLLKFIANENCCSKHELLNTIKNLGVKLNFKNENLIYQIIDELNYSEFITKEIK